MYYFLENSCSDIPIFDYDIQTFVLLLSILSSDPNPSINNFKIFCVVLLVCTIQFSVFFGVRLRLGLEECDALWRKVRLLNCDIAKQRIHAEI